MAVKKKAKAPASKAAAKPAKAPLKSAAKPAKAAKGGKAPKAAAAPQRKRTGLVVGVALGVLALLAGEGYYLARQQASQNIELVQVGPILQSTIPSTRWLCGDAQGDFLRLNGMGQTWRFQKFDPSLRLLAEYKPTKADEILDNARCATAAKDGTVFVLQTNGQIKVLSPDMTYQETLDTHLNDTTAIDIDDLDRLWVVARTDNKVVLFDRQGNRLQELGDATSPSGALAGPVMLVEQPATKLAYVMEGLPEGLRIKEISITDFKLAKSFIIPKERVANFEYLGMGVDPQGRIFFNDQMGGNAVVIYDGKRGKYIGSAKGTNTQQQIVAPGSLGVNRYNGDIFVDFIPGVMKCVMPQPQGK